MSQHDQLPGRPVFGDRARGGTRLLLMLLLLQVPPAWSQGPVSSPDAPDMATMIRRLDSDRRALQRSTNVPLSTRGPQRMRQFWEDALARCDQVDFAGLELDEQVDMVLLRNYIRHELRAIDQRAARQAETAAAYPFAPEIVGLLEATREMKPIDGRRAAETLIRVTESSASVREAVRSGQLKMSPVMAQRAADVIEQLRRSLADWYKFYDGYDPQFSWWNRSPYAKCEPELRQLAEVFRGDLAGRTSRQDDKIIGDPIGEEALLSELEFEMIPYSPAELIELAEKEFEWCQRHRKIAAQEMGLSDDWQAALERVKQLHEPPGQQPELIRMLAEEAVAFLDERELVTIPPLCREIWRMEMMTPERQRVSPFFLGGEVIIVSFPTDAMEHADKLMSLRGNNRHFSRATVHHELIPGHHLQGFMAQRFRPHRSLFNTPFLVEGWALHWELLLWDLGFGKTPEDRTGMLFWRSHRCARIIFSLNFHMGRWTPQQCVDFLIESVGHEPANAEAEVRRSVGGSYGPLYQAAYLLGGLQLRGLHRELVGSGKMSNREFHDAVLLENSIPIEMIRAHLTQEPLTADFVSRWRFYQGPED